MDSDAKRARATATALKTRWTTSLDAMLNDRAISAVVIATPSVTHADCAIRALEAEKHVFCEKPLALDLQSAERVYLQALGAPECRFQIGFHLRFDAVYRALAAHIEQRLLGAVSYASFVLRDMSPPPQEYVAGCGGLFLDGLIHLLDLARWLFDSDFAWLQAFEFNDLSRTSASMDQTVVVAEMASGGIVTFHNSRSVQYGFDCTAEIIGARGSVRTPIDSGSPLLHFSHGRSGQALPNDFLARFRNAYLLELTTFVANVNANAVPSPGIADAYIATAVALSAMRSSAANVRVTPRVELPAVANSAAILR